MFLLSNIGYGFLILALIYFWSNKVLSYLFVGFGCFFVSVSILVGFFTPRCGYFKKYYGNDNIEKKTYNGCVNALVGLCSPVIWLSPHQ